MNGGSTALDWQPDETLSAYAHLTYAYALTQQDSNLSQIVAMNVLTGSASPFQTPQGYYQPDLSNISIRYWLESNPEVAELGTFRRPEAGNMGMTADGGHTVTACPSATSRAPSISKSKVFRTPS